jgi:hypothetical protein
MPLAATLESSRSSRIWSCGVAFVFGQMRELRRCDGGGVGAQSATNVPALFAALSARRGVAFHATSNIVIAMSRWAYPVGRLGYLFHSKRSKGASSGQVTGRRLPWLARRCSASGAPPAGLLDI